MLRVVKTLFLLMLLATAHAQYSNPFTGNVWNNPMSSFVDTMIHNQIQGQIVRDYFRQQQGQQRAATATEAPLPLSATSFTPGPRSQLLWEVAADFSEDRETQRMIAEAIEDYVTSLEGAAREMGKPNNIAMALTFFVTANYFVYSGGVEASDEAHESLWSAFHQGLGSLPEFQAASQAQRRELYDTFMILAAVPVLFYHYALDNGDSEMLQVFRGLAAGNLEMVLGVRADQLHFSASGLELR